MAKHSKMRLIGRPRPNQHMDSDDDIYGYASYGSPGKGMHHKAMATQLQYSPPDSPKASSPPTITPRNANQAKLVELLDRKDPAIVLAVGPAGCGKSMLATVMGMRKLYEGEIQKIVITRPAVSAGEEHGFLPGSITDKLEPWVEPIYDAMRMFYSQRRIKEMLEEKVVEIVPLAYCRGRTFRNSWIILDEAQNVTKQGFLLFTSRIGDNSKMVITGDLAQSDLKGSNGLEDLMHRIGDGLPGEIEKVHFQVSDIERHPIIKTLLRLYKD